MLLSNEYTFAFKGTSLTKEVDTLIWNNAHQGPKVVALLAKNITINLHIWFREFVSEIAELQGSA